MLANADGQVVSPSSLGGSSLNGSRALQNGKERARQQTSAALRNAGTTPSSSEPAAQQPASYFGHDREEVTRILIQALSDLGYNDAAESVMDHSGFALESRPVSEFRKAVLGGHWAEAERLLLGATTATVVPSTPSAPARASGAGLTSSDDRTVGAASNNGSSGSNNSAAGLVLIPGADRDMMRFGIRQQKYLELLEQRETGKALSVLRTELATLYQDTVKLHFLSTLIMCQTADDLKATAEWDGAFGESRQVLLSDLSRLISPSVMLPEHRLAVLLQQVKDYQVSGCVFHTSSTSPSLYSDHFCDKADFPSRVLQELDSHSGEVWQIRFSHDGKRLASCGIGRHVVIWDTTSFKMLLKLDGHNQGVGDVAWSPDDTMLVSCGRDGIARIWDTNTGLLIRLFERFDEPISCCVWAADGRSIVLGSFDKDRALCQWSLAGERIFTWTKKHRTEDVALAPNGQWLIAMDDERHIFVYNFVTRELEYDMELTVRASSISISNDSQLLLVNRQDGEVHLYNIATRGNPVRKYVGATGGDCVIRCGFGGADESFVVSGSEDGKLNIWHKNIGVHMFKLDAHRPRCNAVSWSPSDPCLFATCGDDNKIKIWSNRDRLSQRELESSHSNGVGGRSSNGWRAELSDA